MELTDLLKLNKPGYNDPIDIEVLNENMDKLEKGYITLDEAIKNVVGEPYHVGYEPPEDDNMFWIDLNEWDEEQSNSILRRLEETQKELNNKIEWVNNISGKRITLYGNMIDTKYGSNQTITDALDKKASQKDVGDLSELETKDKTNLVSAINEALESGGGGVRSSAIIVANYDSHENSKKSADIIIGEGEDASIKINEAIESLKGTGGEIKLMEGHYNLNRGILLTANGVHLTGIPKSTVLVQGKQWGGIYSIIDTFRDDGIDTNVEISNLTVKGNGRLTHRFIKGFGITGSTVVNNCIVMNTGGNGFDCRDSSVINNCISIDAGTGGSKANGANGFLCRDSAVLNNCKSINSEGDGFYVDDAASVNNCTSEKSGYYGFLCTGSSITRNCKSVNSEVYGFDCSRAMVLANCTSINSGYVGIRLYSNFTGICTHNILIGDDLENNSENGIVEYNIIKN